jgi:hypothetical protein
MMFKLLYPEASVQARQKVGKGGHLEALHFGPMGLISFEPGGEQPL